MSARRTFTQAAAVCIARSRDVVGAAGLAGLAMIAAATIFLTFAWRQHRLDLESPVRAAAMPPADAPDAPNADSPPRRLVLPPASDVPLLLSRIERAAISQGLGWPKAEYAVNAATNEAPGSLEVRCTLKGPYTNVRRFVTALLQDEPTLTLREFSVVRANIDTPDVEAKLAIVVYVADGGASMLEKPR